MESKAINFIFYDIWRIKLKDLPLYKAIFIKFLRIVILTIKKFDEDKCYFRASALTFYSLLSIVPVFAMAFGIAKGFGFEKLLERELLEQFQNHHEVVIKVIGFAKSLLENTKGGVIAGIGFIMLFWSVLKVLNHIELSFNAVWEIEKSRPIGRKLIDYSAIIFIAPILIILAQSTNVFITTSITLITEKIALLGIFSPFIFFVLKFFPYCMIWIVLSFVYLLMPNTKVLLKTGILAGIVAGTIYQLAQIAYITFQIYVSNYNTIYGSFAALPLFLMWLQISWLIVLLGGEFSYAYQNINAYEFAPDLRCLSISFKKIVALEIANIVIKNFAQGNKALTASQISKKLGIPIVLLNRLLKKFIESNIFVKINNENNKEESYQPATNIDRLTISYIIDAFENSGVSSIPVAKTKEYETLDKLLKEMKNATKNSPANKLLKDI